MPSLTLTLNKATDLGVTAYRKLLLMEETAGKYCGCNIVPSVLMKLIKMKSAICCVLSFGHSMSRFDHFIVLYLPCGYFGLSTTPALHCACNHGFRTCISGVMRKSRKCAIKGKASDEYLWETLHSVCSFFFKQGIVEMCLKHKSVSFLSCEGVCAQHKAQGKHEQTASFELHIVCWRLGIEVQQI